MAVCVCVCVCVCPYPQKYGDGTVRLTCEENVLFVNVPKDNVDAMLAEPLFKKFPTNPGEGGS
jgi:sulfite reductase beta subunit-like hemoprotein